MVRGMRVGLRRFPEIKLPYGDGFLVIFKGVSEASLGAAAA